MIAKFRDYSSTHWSAKKIPKFRCLSCKSLIIHDIAKKKLKRNITGLQNQATTASHVEEAFINNAENAEIPTHSVINADMDEQLDNSNEGWNAHIRLDTNKLFWGLNDDEEDSQDEVEEDGGNVAVEDEVIEAGEDEWKNDGLHVGLMILTIEIGDDP